MLLTHRKPTANLSLYINRYYWGKHSTSANNITMFPLVAGTGVDVYIHFGTSFYVDNLSLSPSHILCPRQHKNISAIGDIDFIAIRFNHGAFRHLCHINFNELNNNFLSIQDIWQQDGDILIDKLYHANTSIHQEQLLNEFFTAQLHKFQKNNSILDQAMRTLYTHHQAISITEISTKLNMSTRHFEHKFKEEFGFSPKKFQVISRFESTLRKLLLSEKTDYLQTVLDTGYYDQSHFIKECKSQTNLSPTDILKYKEDSLHFYFKKI